MTTKAKKAVPSTVLVITLEPDGSGSLLARRGDLAHLSQFTYSGLTEIVTAIQHGATALISVEKNPPALEIPLTVSDAKQPDADEPQSETIETTEAGD